MACKYLLAAVRFKFAEHLGGLLILRTLMDGCTYFVSIRCLIDWCSNFQYLLHFYHFEV